MKLFEIILVSISLAMDAFVVSICKGLKIKKLKINNCLVIGLWFGFFQFLMPSIGFVLGYSFKDIIINIDHWISFLLLSFIGIKMIYESLINNEQQTDDISFKTMFVLAIATSIDALALGIAYVFLYGSNNSLFCFFTIGIITFFLSSIGVIIGHKFGNKFESFASLFGGLVLIMLGIKILIEHLFNL